MRGDTEGAFPIPSLPLKGNKESENTRKHLWTQSLCGFWVSPSPAFGGGGEAGEPRGGHRVLVSGFGMRQGAVSPRPPFPGGRRHTWRPRPRHEGCAALGRCLWRWGWSKAGRAPGHPPEPVKTATSAASSCRQSSENRAPKSVSTPGLGNGKFCSHQYLGSVFFFPSLLSHRK